MFDTKRIKNVLAVLFFVLGAVLPLTAQMSRGLPSAVLVYMDSDYEVSVTQANGTETDAYMGMELLPGDVIHTLNSTAELQLQPNTSILKLAENTIFRFEGFQTNSQTANDFTLLAGKVRTVAARNSRNPSNYNIYTQSAVCGVRGTDFLVGDDGRLVVADGSVLFTRRDSNESIQVDRGMAANVNAAVFAAEALSAVQIAAEMQSFSFIRLDPGTVPREESVSVPPPAEEPAAEAADEAPADETSEQALADAEAVESAETGESAEEPSELVRADIPAFNSVEDDELPRRNGEDANIPAPLAKILNVLGMEIGSTTIDGQTYAKLIVQPTFRIGPLQVSLYAPVIYTDNIFDPSEYYRPAGNNEWSFGSDQHNALDAFADFSRDFFLKIRYIKWGEIRDPFYFKLGNVNDMTLGHGILMFNYANDTDFPSIRKVGLNMGFNSASRTLELVADDLANPQIFGGRIGFGGRFQLGLSTVVDLNPDQNLSKTDSTVYDGVNTVASLVAKDPRMLNFALDLELPIFDNRAFRLVTFADAATFMPILDGKVQTNYLFESSYSNNLGEKFRNYGFAAGVLGRIFSIDYRLEYLYERGYFRHAYYNSVYDRMKGSYLTETLAYQPTEVLDFTHGVYGSLTASFFNFVELTGGYKWPWGKTGPDFSEDHFHLSLVLLPDKIPFIGIHGSISYDRTGLVDSIANRSFSFIDGSTVLKGEVIVPVSPMVDIGLLIASAAQRDTNGNLVYGADQKPEVRYTFTLDTRVHF
jgi:hypothetical protein